jgi:hypothetical protein
MEVVIAFLAGKELGGTLAAIEPTCAALRFAGP